MSKILVPTDGSDYALRAAQYAAGLCKNNPEMRVTVFHVHNLFPDYVFDTPLIPSVPVFAEEQAKAIIDRTVAVFREAGVEVETLVGKGDPGREIAKKAREGRYDQIIMGTRGAGALGGLVFGSVAQKVVQFAECPVTLVK
ncbi:universal stress protein [Desulforudis sp. 1088]|uniref:universal stress protein n=1 Tax=unclassified Candidatus Desulforudis TaxID=2635950 RepID=UPI003CE54D4F